MSLIFLLILLQTWINDVYSSLRFKKKKPDGSQLFMSYNE